MRSIRREEEEELRSIRREEEEEWRHGLPSSQLVVVKGGGEAHASTLHEPLSACTRVDWNFVQGSSEVLISSRGCILGHVALELRVGSPITELLQQQSCWIVASSTARSCSRGSPEGPCCLASFLLPSTPLLGQFHLHHLYGTAVAWS